MTKKLSLPIFFAIYLVSLAAGFGFAGIHHANAIAPASTPNPQSAWILVRVDDMTSEHPRLVSVWAMFMTFSSSPQVFFKPLFSADASRNKYPDLGKVFNVSTDRAISQEFLKALKKLLPHQSGLVIMDEAGFNSFTSWFNQPSTVDEKRFVLPQNGPAIPCGGEARYYNQICRTLETSNHPSLVSLPWRNIVPNHLLAYPSLHSLADLWEQLILSGLNTHCEVIPVQ